MHQLLLVIFPEPAKGFQAEGIESHPYYLADGSCPGIQPYCLVLLEALFFHLLFLASPTYAASGVFTGTSSAFSAS